MFITVKQLAEKVNNLERFDHNELKKPEDYIIAKVTVELTNNGHCLTYFVETKSGKIEQYTENSVPASVISKLNKSKPEDYKHTKNGADETIVYRFT